MSALDKIIAPEIRDDEFYSLIKRLAEEEPLTYVLEIGSSAGGGSTAAFLAGLSKNPYKPKLFCVEISKPRFAVLRDRLDAFPFAYCYNRSTVNVSDFPRPTDVIRFYDDVDSDLSRFPLVDVLEWLQQDIAYVAGAGVEAGAIEQIREDHDIETFDMVLIDGSEFTGEVEFKKVDGARIILLDDTNTFKCYNVRRHLLARADYDLIADNQALRNGFSAFKRRDDFRESALPIHFFTIVLNGEPFIRYHERAFSHLNVPWHWHVVEGVAALKHDTAWSAAAGGHVAASVHDRGRSNDGTSAYLDQLAERYPHQITIYRKPLDEFWDGKREMVAAPLENLPDECLLWQVDADELWTPQQIETVRRMFLAEPSRTAARYWCWYFVGPEKIISTRYNYAQNPQQEWLRTWRFKRGDHWLAHEPPILVREQLGSEPVDTAKIAPFTHDEMERAGVVFQHFAYATEPQLAFKETYYGYKDALAQWGRLQAQDKPGLLRDYLAWVPDETSFDTIKPYFVEPLAKRDATSGAWSFSGSGVLPASARATAVPRPRILIDGLFWQYHSSGIGRVWTNILREWAKTGFSDHVLVLDRAGTAPRIKGIHYWTIARHDYADTGGDSLELERVCRALDADLFVSTYYSTPTKTPSVFFGYDMIPEMLGFDTSRDEALQEKRRAIIHATAHIMISQNSADDLERLYPDLPPRKTLVAHCGPAPHFFMPSAEEVERFCAAHDFSAKSYVLMVGDRVGYRGYKNGELAFLAMAMLPHDLDLTLVCVGGSDPIEPNLTRLAPKVDVLRLELSDDDLRAAFGGAHALIYPSRYEGFGLPPLEAMACGCPAIVCRNSSLPEVVGDEGLFVAEDDPRSVVDILVRLIDPAFRGEVIEGGIERARQFSFESMAAASKNALLEASTSASPARRNVWAEFRELQACLKTVSEAAADSEKEVVELQARLKTASEPAADSEKEVVLLRDKLDAAESEVWRQNNIRLRTRIKHAVVSLIREKAGQCKRSWHRVMPKRDG